MLCVGVRANTRLCVRRGGASLRETEEEQLRGHLHGKRLGRRRLPAQRCELSLGIGQLLGLSVMRRLELATRVLHRLAQWLRLGEESLLPYARTGGQYLGALAGAAHVDLQPKNLVE